MYMAFIHCIARLLHGHFEHPFVAMKRFEGKFQTQKMEGKDFCCGFIDIYVLSYAFIFKNM